MIDINLETITIKKYHKVLYDIINHKYTHYWFKGGRGSTKSSFISLMIPILMIINPTVNALVLRKVGNTLKDSVYNQILWAIDTLGLNALFKTTISPLSITYIPTKQQIFFRGSDEPLKIKSIKAKNGYIGIVWLNF